MHYLTQDVTTRMHDSDEKFKIEVPQVDSIAEFMQWMNGEPEALAWINSKIQFDVRLLARIVYRDTGDEKSAQDAIKDYCP